MCRAFGTGGCEDLVQRIAEDGEQETDFGIGHGLIGREVGHDRAAARDGAGGSAMRASCRLRGLGRTP